MSRIRCQTELLKKTVLLYAVASNNLNENILSDKSEILKAAESLNLEGVSMLVYQVTLDHSVPPTLRSLRRKKDGSPKFEILKEYDRKLYSTDPERLSQVVEDVANLRKADSYGLIFWGHGSGFDPEFSAMPPVAEMNSHLLSFRFIRHLVMMLTMTKTVVIRIGWI